MKTSKVITISLILTGFLAFVYTQNYFLSPKTAPVESAPAEQPKTSQLPESAAPASSETPVAEEPVAEAAVAEPTREEITSLNPDDARAVAEQGLATLERIRAVPGAAPLVDEIVGFLQSNPYQEFSLEYLGADEDGLVEVNEDTIKRMIRNDDIREKWQRLMGLVAKNPEIVSALQGQREQ